VDYFAQVVHKMWMSGGILIHSIHKPLFDLAIQYPQPVDRYFFTPIIRDLTTQNLREFNFLHNCNKRYPQVMHTLWVNYIHVIPGCFGMISGMSQEADFKIELFRKYQVARRSIDHMKIEAKFVRLNRVR